MSMSINSFSKKTESAGSGRKWRNGMVSLVKKWERDYLEYLSESRKLTFCLF